MDLLDTAPLYVSLRQSLPWWTADPLRWPLYGSLYWPWEIKWRR